MPGEHALGPDDEAGPEGFDRGGGGGEVLLEAGGAGGVADVDVEVSGVQVDAGVVWVRGLIVAWRHDSVLRGDGSA
jgi:hypothetical protein